jgi:hypothetical protein
MNNKQDMSSENEEWLAQDRIERMRAMLAKIDANNLVTMPAPFPAAPGVDVSWTVEKSSVPGHNPRENTYAEMCNGVGGCYRAKAVCTCDKDGEL